MYGFLFDLEDQTLISTAALMDTNPLLNLLRYIYNKVFVTHQQHGEICVCIRVKYMSCTRLQVIGMTLFDVQVILVYEVY